MVNDGVQEGSSLNHHQSNGVSAENINYKRQKRVYLTQTEYMMLISSIKEPLIRLITETLWYTRLRFSELAGLSVKDVNFDECIIHVAGKPGSCRDIPIHKDLLPKLKAYRESEQATAKLTDHFFTTTGIGEISESFYNRVLKKTTGSLGWSKKVTAHVIRDSFVTDMLNRATLGFDFRVCGRRVLNDTRAYIPIDNTATIKSAIDSLNSRGCMKNDN